MKICFFLQRRFAYIGHAMAIQIKELAPHTEFCGVVHSRQSFEFIKNQKDISYTDLLCDEDIHKTLYDEKIDDAYLSWLEKEYGVPNLWPYLYIDRIIMNGQFLREYPYNKPTLTRDEMLQCVQVNAKAIIAFLEREKPDTVVFSVIGSVASTLLYHIAKKKGIQVINMEFARIGNRIAFSEDDQTFTWVHERFLEIEHGASSDHLEAAEAFLRDFRGAPAPYDAEYMKEFYTPKTRFAALSFLNPRKLLVSIPWYTKTLLNDLKRKKLNDYDTILVWWSMWDKLKRTLRMMIGYADLYTEADLTQRFAYYPFHIEPEIAMMRYAPYYPNQIELIKTIARALPIDMFLYVKEHPGMVGYRPRSYYKELLKIPNVRLIDPATPGNELSKRAEVTTTITSTAAWEARLCNKPAVTFGNVFFNDVPGVVRCHGYEELPHLIKTQLEEWKPDDRPLINYIAALLEDSIVVDFQAMWNDAVPFEVILKDKGMRDLSHMLFKKARARILAHHGQQQHS